MAKDPYLVAMVDSRKRTLKLANVISANFITVIAPSTTT